MILTILHREPMHGYGISQKLAALSDDTFQVNPGSLFPSLYRLEEDGKLKAEWRPTENNCRFSAGWDPRFSKPFPLELFLRLTAFSVPYSVAPVQRKGGGRALRRVRCRASPSSNRKRLWECGNLACCARFPSDGGPRVVRSTGAAFP